MHIIIIIPPRKLQLRIIGNSNLDITISRIVIRKFNILPHLSSQFNINEVVFQKFGIRPPVLIIMMNNFPSSLFEELCYDG